MAKPEKTARLRIRLYFEDGSMFGPGKADLLALIAETGSIAAAGRRMGMSYKRAWGLVEVMNAMFAEPLVESSRGGAKHGGARLTGMGWQVLDLYRGLEAKTRASAAHEIGELADLVQVQPAATTARDMSEGK